MSFPAFYTGPEQVESELEALDRLNRGARSSTLASLGKPIERFGARWQELDPVTPLGQVGGRLAVDIGRGLQSEGLAGQALSASDLVPQKAAGGGIMALLAQLGKRGQKVVEEAKTGARFVSEEGLLNKLIELAESEIDPETLAEIARTRRSLGIKGSAPQIAKMKKLSDNFWTDGVYNIRRIDAPEGNRSVFRLETTDGTAVASHRSLSSAQEGANRLHRAAWAGDARDLLVEGGGGLQRQTRRPPVRLTRGIEDPGIERQQVMDVPVFRTDRPYEDLSLKKIKGRIEGGGEDPGGLMVELQNRLSEAKTDRQYARVSDLLDELIERGVEPVPTTRRVIPGVGGQTFTPFNIRRGPEPLSPHPIGPVQRFPMGASAEDIAAERRLRALRRERARQRFRPSLREMRQMRDPAEATPTAQAAPEAPAAASPPGRPYSSLGASELEAQAANDLPGVIAELERRGSKKARRLLARLKGGGDEAPVPETPSPRPTARTTSVDPLPGPDPRRKKSGKKTDAAAENARPYSSLGVTDLEAKAAEDTPGVISELERRKSKKAQALLERLKSGGEEVAEAAGDRPYRTLGIDELRDLSRTDPEGVMAEISGNRKSKKANRLLEELRKRAK